MFAANTFTEPDASNTAVKFVQAAVGAVVSTTVTVRTQLVWLLHASVAVKVTVAEPVAPHWSLSPL
jgi:hypothetical protein